MGRKVFSPDLPITAIDYRNTPPAPKQFPVVVRSSCTQDGVGTKIVQDAAGWNAHMADIRSRPASHFDRRKQFYFKWLRQLKVTEARILDTRWEDMVLWHCEP